MTSVHMDVSLRRVCDDEQVLDIAALCFLDPQEGSCDKTP